jgi:flavin reductase (DIM6/NTAB) family NADH-FMN oxidoreductase RutF
VTILAHRDGEVIGEEVWQAAKGFASGVSVVTAGSGDRAHGGTVSAFSVISREPSLATIALRSDSFLLDRIREHGTFVINVLGAGQVSLARRFASRGRPTGLAQFDGVPLTEDSADVPVLAGTVCWLRCRPTSQMSAGDHELVLGEVLRWARGDGGEPLLYLAGSLFPAHTLVNKEVRS